MFVRDIDMHRLISAITSESNLFQVQFWYDCLICRGVGDLHPDDFSRSTSGVAYSMCMLRCLSTRVFMCVFLVCCLCKGVVITKIAILGWGYCPRGSKFRSY